MDFPGHGGAVFWRPLLAYILYRHLYPDAFAIGSRHTNLLYGTLNTAILLTSSLTMALAVHAARESKAKSTVRFLLLTLLFAVGFLVVKGFEYHEDIVQRLVPGPALIQRFRRAPPCSSGFTGR